MHKDIREFKGKKIINKQVEKCLISLIIREMKNLKTIKLFNLPNWQKFLTLIYPVVASMQRNGYSLNTCSNIWQYFAYPLEFIKSCKIHSHLILRLVLCPYFTHEEQNSERTHGSWNFYPGQCSLYSMIVRELKCRSRLICIMSREWLCSSI